MSLLIFVLTFLFVLICSLPRLFAPIIVGLTQSNQTERCERFMKGVIVHGKSLYEDERQEKVTALEKVERERELKEYRAEQLSFIQEAPKTNEKAEHCMKEVEHQ